MSAIIVEPSSGVAGSQVTVTGSGFKAGQNLRIALDARILAAATADANGVFTVPVTIPANRPVGPAVLRMLVASATSAKFVVADPPPPPPPTGNVRYAVWANVKTVTQLTDTELDTWASRGVGGFVCSVQWLTGLGGGEYWTTDATLPPAPAAGTFDRYAVQRSIRNSRIVERCAARGIVVWLSCYLDDYNAEPTVMADWFNDAAWAKLLPEFGKLAAAARALGCKGVGWDGENYHGDGTWVWNYPGNTHTEAETRAAAQHRGEQVAAVVADAFPGSEAPSYYWYFPGCTQEWVWHYYLNQPADNVKSQVQHDFWRGYLSEPRLGAFRLLDAAFYKDFWPGEMARNREAFNRWIVNNVPNARDRACVSPFIWIDPGPASSTWDDPRPVPHVAKQLANAATEAEGGFVGLYAQHLRTFDYGPYVETMRLAVGL